MKHRIFQRSPSHIADGIARSPRGCNACTNFITPAGGWCKWLVSLTTPLFGSLALLFVTQSVSVSLSDLGTEEINQVQLIGCIIFLVSVKVVYWVTDSDTEGYFPFVLFGISSELQFINCRHSAFGTANKYNKEGNAHKTMSKWQNWRNQSERLWRGHGSNIAENWT